MNKFKNAFMATVASIWIANGQEVFSNVQHLPTENKVKVDLYASINNNLQWSNNFWSWYGNSWPVVAFNENNGKFYPWSVSNAPTWITLPNETILSANLNYITNGGTLQIIDNFTADDGSWDTLPILVHQSTGIADSNWDNDIDVLTAKHEIKNINQIPAWVRIETRSRNWAWSVPPERSVLFKKVISWTNDLVQQQNWPDWTPVEWVTSLSTDDFNSIDSKEIIRGPNPTTDWLVTFNTDKQGYFSVFDMNGKLLNMWDIQTNWSTDVASRLGTWIYIIKTQCLTENNMPYIQTNKLIKK